MSSRRFDVLIGSLDPCRGRALVTTFAFVFAAAVLPMQASRCTALADATCSTFVLTRESTVVVGHNLDDYTDVSGLIVVNARGVTKESVTLQDIQSLGLARSAPRLSWTSRYGSVTYSVFGREFPDGGLNEAGLYVGEMTLMATKWPDDSPLPRMYHHQWVQYLLDSCATVDEVVASLAVVLPEGHCRWHFLVAERSGRAAVIEFLEGEPVVYAGESLPHSIACNDPYQAELDDIRNYDGFGGTRDPEPHYELEDPRFRWAAVMLSEYDGSAQPANYAFSVLDRLDLGNRKWAVVCDMSELRMYYRTSRSPEARWVDLGDFDFVDAALPVALDIDRNLEGNAAAHFAALTGEWNRNAVRNAWANIDAGFFGNLFFKPLMIRGLSRAGSALALSED